MFLRDIHVDGLDGTARLIPHPHMASHLTPSNITCTAAEIAVVWRGVTLKRAITALGVFFDPGQCTNSCMHPRVISQPADNELVPKT